MDRILKTINADIGRWAWINISGDFDGVGSGIKDFGDIFKHIQLDVLL